MMAKLNKIRKVVRFFFNVLKGIIWFVVRSKVSSSRFRVTTIDFTIVKLDLPLFLNQRP